MLKLKFSHSYKMNIIEQYVGDQPFVWLDDDIWPDAHAWERARNKRGIPTLLLDVNPATGLTDEDFEKVRAFGEATLLDM